MPKPEFRLLVTGSRTWDDVATIDYWIQRFTFKHMIRYRLVLISGHCPRGADSIAEEIAKKYSWGIDLYPADWKTYGRRAGFVRNELMVTSANPSWCIAFIRDSSNGASMCRNLAKKHGIPTRTVLYGSPVNNLQSRRIRIREHKA